MKKALITGITGQDGSYLAELLLSKGYKVYGMVRRSSNDNLCRIHHLLSNNNLYLRSGDLLDSYSIMSLISEIEPNEVYNLAAQSHVKLSFDLAEFTTNVNAIGPLKILDSIVKLGLQDKTRFYQASTSEMFGKVQEIPQNENTPFYPRSPYGVAKAYAHWITKNYRESYFMYACSGILFNHESPRRGIDFVTNKIVLGLNNIKSGKQDCINLGNIDAKRDWGHAKDYVNAMWLMLQQESPNDYVISTGEENSVKDFVNLAAEYFNFNIEWKGSGIGQYAIDKNTGNTIIKSDPRFFRPAEVDSLLGNPSMAIKKLGWNREYGFKDLVFDMCKNSPKNFPNYIEKL
jgi:GDPmannose 4,6-dehydratase